MKKLFQVAFVILFIAFYCLYLNRYSFIVANNEIELDDSEKYYDYRGITNVHSILSTGSSSPSEVVTVAQESKIDFLIFTEVNLLEHDQPLEGYFNAVTVLEAGLYSYLDARVLYYNAPLNQPPSSEGQAQVYFADLLSQFPRSADSGSIILAHPFHSRYPWTGEYPKGLDGIEVINLKRILEVALRDNKFNSIWSILTYPLNAHLSLLRVYKDPQQELELWDKLAQERKVIGIMGTDATAKAILFPGYFIKFPSYATAFSVASNHVLLKSELTGDFKTDKSKILSALQEGQFYFSLDILGNPKGFWTEMRSKGKTYLFGSEFKHSEDLQIVVHLPSTPLVPYEVRIIKDGVPFATSNATDTTMNIHSPGVYRIVVRLLVPMPFPEGKKWIPWIYTNPFYVR